MYLVVGEQLTLVCPDFDSYIDPTEDTEWFIEAKGAKKLQKGEMRDAERRNNLSTDPSFCPLQTSSPIPSALCNPGLVDVVTG